MTAGPINPSVALTASPAILEARAWLDAYRGDEQRLDLSQAAPPYAPPDELLERISQAARDPEFARYGAVPGELPLRAEYARHVSAIYGTEILLSQVSITAGCNQAFMIAIMCVANRGDEIVLPMPWYFNNKMTLDMFGIGTRALPCLPEQGFIPDLTLLETMLDKRVKAVVLVSPNNPTGATYPPATIDAISELCCNRGIWLIIDETYRDFLPIHTNTAPHGAYSRAGRENTIGLYSFSKSLAIPGLRLGAMIYPEALAEHVIKVQDCMQICPERPGQIGVTWALSKLTYWRQEKRQLLSKKGITLNEGLKDTPGWKIASIGAYFAYLQHPYDVDAKEVARKLASEKGILLIPGSYFGMHQESYLRLSFAALTPDSLRSFLERLSS